MVKNKSLRHLYINNQKRLHSGLNYLSPVEHGKGQRKQSGVHFIGEDSRRKRHLLQTYDESVIT